jgi:hypothetical protein
MKLLLGSVGTKRARTPARLAAMLATVLAGCGLPVAGSSADDLASRPPPVPYAALNLYADNAGLLTGVTADGKPVLSGPGADPLILEAYKFYDTLQRPFAQPVAVDYPDPFTGQSSPTRKTAPLTVDDWKTTFGIPAALDETTQAYRDRIGVAVYYNQNELGLGRELGCARFIDGYDVNGAALEGVACFVTNHGAGFRQGLASLQAAIDGAAVTNTVCITYRPTMDPGYQVQFYVYGADGKRQNWARLDTLGPRPHPRVCMNCHGGAYDEARHLAKNAHFLPLDPNLVLFAEGNGLPAGVTRDGQEDRIRTMNALAAQTPLTPAQDALLVSLYGGAVATAGTRAAGDGVPDAWAVRDEDRDFYHGVVKPYCATCHLAGQRWLGDGELAAYGMFATPALFDRAPLLARICNSFSMPNAQPTSLRFWDTRDNPGVMVAGTRFRTAADAMLARQGLDRSACVGLDDLSGCNRGPDPDALCGGAVAGGATCDLVSNRCVPVATPLQ